MYALKKKRNWINTIRCRTNHSMPNLMREDLHRMPTWERAVEARGEINARFKRFCTINCRTAADKEIRTPLLNSRLGFGNYD